MKQKQMMNIQKDILLITNDEYTEGHTTNYIVVKAKGTNLENTKQFVKIEKTEQNILIGKIM